MVIDVQLTMYTLYGVIGLLLAVLHNVWLQKVYWETKYEERTNSSHTAQSYEYMRGLNMGTVQINEYLTERLEKLEAASEPLEEEEEEIEGEELERGRW